MSRLFAIDSHTGGEPTRVIPDAGLDLGDGTVAERASRLTNDFPTFFAETVGEPRGSDILVGALLVEPSSPACDFGVIFYNPVGLLGMCGHGTIGLMATLSYLGRIGPGEFRIETPAGVVTATLHPDARVSVENVESFVVRSGVRLSTPHGTVSGDVAWGGNHFFLCEDHDLDISMANLDELTLASKQIRRAVNETFPQVDHVELFGPPTAPGADSKSFVLCPGGAYDRSPCGTGTSAKLATLAARGKLAPGELWRQESVTGSVFEATYRPSPSGNGILPTITGTADVVAETTLVGVVDTIQ